MSALLTTACPGDDGTPADGTTSSSTSTGSTGPATSTTTTGADSTSTSGPGADSTSTSTSGGSESSDSSTGEPPGSGYGDCLDDEMACAPGEVCVSVGPFAVCSEQGCRSADECEMAPSGEASPACDDIDGDFSVDCYLDCSAGACPEGMACIEGTVCIWAPQPPGGGMCPDGDAGNMVPTTFMGDSTGLFDDAIQTCGGGGGDDALIMFTAPANDTYRFDTMGTGFDTTLSILDMCGGNELACNDDVAPMVLTSEVEVSLMEGQSVIVVIDSFNGQVGPYTLNIDERGLGG